ncbi:MAG: S8 family serine peptidase [bacterium]
MRIRGRYIAAVVTLSVVFFLMTACGGQPTVSVSGDLPNGGQTSPAGITVPVPPYLVDQILVKFENRVPVSTRDQVLSRLGAERIAEIGGIGTLVLKVPAGLVEAKVGEFLRQPGVEYAEPDYVHTAFLTPNDTYWGLQWGQNNTGQSSSNCFAAGTADADIDGPEAWDLTTGSSSVRIAVLDTGIQDNHPDLSGKVVLARSFIGGSPKDGHGHGSNVAGIAAAKSNNAIGVAGTCWLCSLMNGKVLNNAGSGSASSSSNGITWAADNGAKVINMSYGSSSFSQTEQNAVSYAWNQKGVVLVAAAGNSNSSSFFYPAHYSNVIAVAATENNDVKASFSNYGSWVHVAAPGYCIASTYKNSGYVYMSGTSQASPHVAGEAGLIFSKFPAYTNAQVRDKIFSSVDAISGTGTYWVYGRINAWNAVQ